MPLESTVDIHDALRSLGYKNNTAWLLIDLASGWAINLALIRGWRRQDNQREGGRSMPSNSRAISEARLRIGETRKMLSFFMRADPEVYPILLKSLRQTVRKLG